MRNVSRYLCAVRAKFVRAFAPVNGRGSVRRYRSSTLARTVTSAFVAWVMALLALPAVHANPYVRMDFNLFLNSRARGTLFIELFDDRPITRDNFLAYTNGGKYDNSLMHRLARNFVLQGGGYEAELSMYVPLQEPLYTAIDPDPVDLDGNPATANPMITNEFGNAPPRSNVAGTLAMAKLPGNPNSATSEFFFNMANNASNLDNQN